MNDMNAEKQDFLRDKLVSLLRQIPSETKPLWGKMTLQQMVEHYTESVRIASGRAGVNDVVTPVEQIPRYQDFLMSDKPFRENTVNPTLPEVPAPVRNKSTEDALKELSEELLHFFSVFEANDHLVTINPVFGELNFQMNVQLLHKHALHHLRQFGITPEKAA